MLSSPSAQWEHLRQLSRRSAFGFFRTLARSLLRLGLDVTTSRISLVKESYERLYEKFRPDGSAVASTSVGPLWVDADKRGAAPRLLLFGTYEPAVGRAIEICAEPGMRVFDIGANVGFFTRLAASAVAPNGQVVAFEPDPENLVQLRRNATLTSVSVLVESFAVADSRTVARLYRDHRSNTRSSLEIIGQRGVRDVQAVATISLDEWCDDHRIESVDLIKIDIEGAEMRALAGARATIAKSRPLVIVEVWPQGLRAHGADFVDVIDWLESNHYECTPIGENFLDRKVTGIGDLHFVPPSQVEQPDGSRHINLLCRPLSVRGAGS